MRKIVITGASEGIGEAIAKRLINEDVQLVLVARNKEKLDALCVELGDSCTAIQCDLTDVEQLKALAEQVGAVDVLINNAGVWHKRSQLDEIDVETIEKVIATNLTSHITLTNLLLPKLRQSETPAIVNIISKSGVTAQDGQTVYTASKWGMKGFTDVLRVDLADTNFRIGAVYQAGTATDMFKKAEETMPWEKFTPPEDLAEVIAFMLTRPEKIWLNEVHVTF